MSQEQTSHSALIIQLAKTNPDKACCSPTCGCSGRTVEGQKIYGADMATALEGHLAHYPSLVPLGPRPLQMQMLPAPSDETGLLQFSPKTNAALGRPAITNTKISPSLGKGLESLAIAAILAIF